MPNYDYECSRCKKTFEAFQSMKDNAYTTCPKDKCRMKSWGRGKVKRLLGTGAGLIFKGSGFYITDYRSEGYKSAAKSEASASGASSTTASGEAGKSGASTPSKSEGSGSETKSTGKKAASKKD